MKLSPWRNRASLLPFSSEFEDLLGRFWDKPMSEFTSHLPEVFQSRNFPAVNVSETEDNYCVTMDCPGLEEKDINVQLTGNTLVISGERNWEEEKKDKEYHRVESQYGKFERTIPLDANLRLEPGEVDATYKQGVLTIVIPKLEKTPTAKIEVQAQ